MLGNTVFWLWCGHYEHTASADNNMRPAQDLQHSILDEGGDYEGLPFPEKQLAVKWFWD